MRYAKLIVEPIGNNPNALAKVSVEIPLGDGMHLHCLNAFIARKRSNPDELIVLYPKSRAINGRDTMTWGLFSEDQRKFDAAVIAEYQRLVVEKNDCTELDAA